MLFLFIESHTHMYTHTHTEKAITQHVCDGKSMGSHKSVNTAASIMFSSLFCHSALCRQKHERLEAPYMLQQDIVLCWSTSQIIALKSLTLTRDNSTVHRLCSAVMDCLLAINILHKTRDCTHVSSFARLYYGLLVLWTSYIVIGWSLHPHSGTRGKDRGSHHVSSIHLPGHHGYLFLDCCQHTWVQIKWRPCWLCG